MTIIEIRCSSVQEAEILRNALSVILLGRVVEIRDTETEIQTSFGGIPILVQDWQLEVKVRRALCQGIFNLRNQGLTADQFDRTPIKSYEVLSLTPRQLEGFRNFGPKSIQRVREYLAANNIDCELTRQ